jgi:hypothetical protein
MGGPTLISTSATLMPYDSECLARSNQRHCERIWHYLSCEGLVHPDHYALASRPFIQGLSLEPCDLSVDDRRTPEHDAPRLVFSRASELLEWALPMIRTKLGAQFSCAGWEGFVGEVLDSVHNSARALAARNTFEEALLRRTQSANVDVGACACANCKEDDRSKEEEVECIWDLLRRSVKTCSSLSSPSCNVGQVLDVDSENELLLWEQLSAFQGHPFHPGSKCKVGWTEEQVIQYSPEFTAMNNALPGKQQQDKATGESGVHVLLAAGRAHRIAVSVAPRSIRGSVGEIDSTQSSPDWNKLLPGDAFSRWCRWVRQVLHADPAE